MNDVWIGCVYIYRYILYPSNPAKAQRIQRLPNEYLTMPTYTSEQSVWNPETQLGSFLENRTCWIF